MQVAKWDDRLAILIPTAVANPPPALGGER